MNSLEFLRSTKIVATVGTATDDVLKLKSLITAGVNVFRLNFSHGNHGNHLKRITNIRSVEKEIGCNVAILADLQGPKFRIGEVKSDIKVIKGNNYIFDKNTEIGDFNRVNLSHDEIYESLSAGSNILMDDGKLQFVVKNITKDKIYTEVIVGGYVKSNKGVNLPDVVVNTSPLTPKDIDENHGHAAGLAKKLKLALQYLPAVGIKGILQGDFMFDNDDVETEDIDGIPHYTFKPNTIRYAVEANSELGKQVIAARIGIIFHTTYNDLSGGGASFGADISGLSKSPSVWFDDAYFKDDTGILLSDQEEKFVLEKINEADSINVDYTNLPLKNLNTYINSEIIQGEFLNDPSKSFEKFKNWYQQAVDKSIEKVKRPESKERKKLAGEEKLKEFNAQKQDIINIFKVSKLLSEAKSIFITKYDKAVATKHFIDNGDGTLSVTKAEGFVAVDHTESGIKLVDRLEFSKNNFNAGKPGS